MKKQELDYPQTGDAPEEICYFGDNTQDLWYFNEENEDEEEAEFVKQLFKEVNI